MIARLTLADGWEWILAPENGPASSLVSLLAQTMRLERVPDQGLPPPDRTARRVVVCVDEGYGAPEADPSSSCKALEPSGRGSGVPPEPVAVLPRVGRGFELENATVCTFPPAADMAAMARQMQWVGGMIGRQCEARGGVMLHAALMEWAGRGVILAGPGGRGKTTASRRLPASWKTLSDDLVLVVRTEEGSYYAHPWPTWSRFMWGGSGGTWDVQHAVPVGALFFLDRAEADSVEPVGAGQAVTLLVKTAEQANLQLNRGMKRGALRRARLERFESLCALARATPAYTLRLSLHGEYWRLLEQILS